MKQIERKPLSTESPQSNSLQGSQSSSASKISSAEKSSALYNSNSSGKSSALYNSNSSGKSSSTGASTHQGAGKPPSNNVPPGPTNNPNKPNNSPGPPPPPPPPPPPHNTNSSDKSSEATESSTSNSSKESIESPKSLSTVVYDKVYDKVREKVEEELPGILYKKGEQAIDYLWNYFTGSKESPVSEGSKESPVSEGSKESSSSEQSPATTNEKPQNLEPSNSKSNPESKPIGASLSGDNCRIETYFFVAPGCENKGKLCIIKQSCGESSLEAICPSTKMFDFTQSVNPVQIEQPKSEINVKSAKKIKKNSQN